MILRKEFFFIFVAVSIVMPFQKAFAYTIDSSMPFFSSYNFQNDPFTFKWTFETKKEEKEVENVPVSREEQILNRWKEKQAHLWQALSKENFIINASAYTASADECGKSDGITASGLKVEENRTLACPPSYPFGTKIAIEGVGVLRCEDRGGAIKGNHFDIYMETKQDAFAFGRRNLVAKIVD